MSTEYVPTIIEYAESIGVSLYPVHRFILKLYYGLPLDAKMAEGHKAIHFRSPVDNKEYIFSEKGYLEFLYGEGRCSVREQNIPNLSHELVLVLGRRGGTTWLSSLIASYETLKLLQIPNPQKRYGLGEGNRIQVLTITEDKDAASQVHSELGVNIAKTPLLYTHAANSTLSYYTFRTDQDIQRFGVAKEVNVFLQFAGKATIRTTVKASRAKGLRGSGNKAVILAGLANYEDPQSIYRAVIPSTLCYFPKDEQGRPQGDFEGRIVQISSPSLTGGEFFSDQFTLAMNGGCLSKLGLQIPSWEANPTLPHQLLQEYLTNDPLAFHTEFGAQFNHS